LLHHLEIAALTWTMLTDANGRIAQMLELPARAAKSGSGPRLGVESKEVVHPS
jgi:hypothetical protein